MSAREPHPGQQPEWIARSGSAGIRLLGIRRQVPVAHAEGTCRQLDDPPRRYCSLVTAVEQLTVGQDSLRIRWHADTYCRQIESGTPALLGWNVVLTLQGGHAVVAVRRASELSFGGCWTVSAAETVTPDDLPDNAHEHAVDTAAITARALDEELGITAARTAIEEASNLLGVFRAGRSFGVAVSVDGDLLGVTGRDIRRSWAGAESAWEGVPQVEEVQHILEDQQRAWAPWAKGCIAAAAKAAGAPGPVHGGKGGPQPRHPHR